MSSSEDSATAQYSARVRDLFDRALDLPEDRRDEFLRTEAGSDVALLQELRSLLSNHSDDGFLERSTAAALFTRGQRVAQRYRISRLVGSGGMGEVYEAEDGELGERVALKVVRPSIADNGNVLARFRREIQLARRITHPNICRVFDVAHHVATNSFGQPLRSIFVSMEMLDGVTLSSLIREQGRLTTDVALRIARQLAAGLEAAHAASVIHRDFKSSNVMLVGDVHSPALRVVITDFGLAREIEARGDDERLTDSDVLVGTPDYMAPEQVEGGALSAATDVYAFGVVLYEMVTGRLPFESTTPLSAAVARLKSEPPSPRSIVPELGVRWERVILRCLERDPHARFQRPSDVIDALEPTAAMPRPARRTMKPFALALTLIALIAVAVTLWFSSRRAPAAAKAPVTNIAPASTRRVARPAVAVLGFRNLSGDGASAWYSGAFTELLSGEIAASDALRLVSPAEIASVRSDLRLDEQPALALTQLPAIRQRLGADLLVTGSYLATAAGNHVRVDVRVQNATGGVLHTLSATGTRDQLLPLISQIGGQLRDRLGVAPLSSAASVGLRASLPHDVEAARAYIDGLERSRRYDALGAQAALERAVTLEPKFAMSHLALAEVFWNLGNEPLALSTAQKALALSSELQREERLSIEARVNVFDKKFDRAIEIYRSLVTFFPDDINYGLRLALTQVAAGKVRDALDTLGALRSLPKPFRDDPMIDLVSADAYHQLHDLQKEIDAAKRAEVTATVANMRGVVARAKANQAYALRDLGKPEESIRLLNEAIRIYEELGDRGATARAMSNLALTMWNQGDLKTAEPMLERALIMQEQVGNRTAQSRTLNALGMIRFSRGNIDGAEEMWQRAIVIQREWKILPQLGPTLSNMGGVYQLRGDFVSAAKYYSDAREVSRTIDERFGEVVGTVNLGELRRFEGRYAEAEELYGRALQMARENKLPQNEAYVLAALGDMWLARRDFERSRRLQNEALALRRKSGEKVGAAMSETLLANVEIEAARVSVARPLLASAIGALAENGAAEEEAAAQESLARAALIEKDLVSAEKALARARELTAKSRTVALLGSIDTTGARVLLARGKRDEALRTARRAEENGKRSSVLLTWYEARLALADVTEARGDHANAAKMREAVAREAQRVGMQLIVAKASR